MQTDVDNNGRKVFWFEKDPDGNAVLVRPSGKRTFFRKKSDMPAMSDFGREGWQRAMLFGELHDCLDTNFACAMDATLGTNIFLLRRYSTSFSSRRSRSTMPQLSR